MERLLVCQSNICESYFSFSFLLLRMAVYPVVDFSALRVTATIPDHPVKYKSLLEVTELTEKSIDQNVTHQWILLCLF